LFTFETARSFGQRRFRLTNVIPERIIFVSRGITVQSKNILEGGLMLKHLRHTHLATKNLEGCCGNALIFAHVAAKWKYVDKVR